MRFLLDESVEARIGTFLNEHSHDATRIASDHPAGLSDTEVLAIAYREQRILITNDKDFGDLVVQRQLPHAGVILFRLPWNTTIERKAALLQHVLHTRQAHLGRFLVVTPGSVRIR